jgi:ParB/RepB/Spo0J family partition protein
MNRVIGEMDVPISDIRVGDRIREDLGDLSSLQISIEIHGQVQPIIIQKSQTKDGMYELIDGERRLQVAKRMGLKEIHCRLFESLKDDDKAELELELCIRRKQLTYAEEARAVKRVVENKKRQNMAGGLGKFGSRVKNKDIAETLGMSPATLSKNLTIAKALEDHPQIETICTNMNQALTMIRRKEFITPQESLTRKIFEDCYTNETPMELIDSLDKKIADLIVLHPETVDKELVTKSVDKLKLGGSMILFVEMADLGEWLPFLKSLDIYVEEQPMIWAVKGEGTYYTYLWCGKSRQQPIRFLSQHVSYARSADCLSLKAKSPKLWKNFIHCCTEQGGYVVIPDCRDIEAIKVAYDMQRNVIASCSDSILRDKLIMISGR